MTEYHLNLNSLLKEYFKTRKLTEALCSPLKIEDYVIQAIPESSPPKWHLAHTTWFFENFILLPFAKNYQCFDEKFGFIFNSYYQTVGEFLERSRRGVLSRPETEEIYRYRSYVDQAISEVVNQLNGTEEGRAVGPRLELGIHHEQQHQELLLTDLKMGFWSNPLRPAYISAATRGVDLKFDRSPRLDWVEFSEGMQLIGYSGYHFSFDNERPSHSVFMGPFKLASRLVTNGEFLEFVKSKGYMNPEYWLSDGWLAIQKNRWAAPLYWEERDGKWNVMTLFGMQPLAADDPVCHISYYEADAYARWTGKRLPREAEWEKAARTVSVKGNFLEAENFKAVSASGSATSGTSALTQIFGDVWEWTQSSYLAYPGFIPLEGSLGEYNGKFMCNQMVLRGGSFATPHAHIRPSYRNFFPPDTRWQFTGLRLAEDK